MLRRRTRFLVLPHVIRSQKRVRHFADWPACAFAESGTHRRSIAPGQAVDAGALFRRVAEMGTPQRSHVSSRIRQV
ncbi:hypothetical protein CBM2634_B10033 [Cupriavidus taiwanensis]|uniref:Uncharacterized protein n=1 Tax=Cupriavidus taiwanensis TaxID=164546 RepID=A0A375J6I1_9BURK|nr:hypothetical protein CBM2634_B10033 [Cupriavidus taiwanensis]